MGGWKAGVLRVLALELVAAVPTVLVLAQGAAVLPVMVAGAGCLGLGYLLIRIQGSRPLDEGAWLGVAIGGGIGLAQAEAAMLAAAEQLAWVRPWLISIVACAGIGIALGFLARYDQHHRALRATLRTSASAQRRRLQG